MKFKNPFSDLSKFELSLWLTSVFVIIGSFILSSGNGIASTIASLIGVTALIFIAKGYIIGQVLCVIFALLYGIISLHFKYYGEMITYIFMSAPAAIAAIISWLRHPYKDTKEVEISRLSKFKWIMMIPTTLAVTVLFYFLLDFLGNANLIISTISITTSFAASYLLFFRSPYYAVAYSSNDIVLIVLWILASIEDISYIPMIFCFIMFLANDIYGFVNWKRMQKRQKE
ncbi:MAG: nicotinamide mononucleotide transporter [Ruminococcaceae bacterium]|nr:nicotinamide mononucleotide transporter [Oscillospiraceae bacterium]